MFAKRTNLLDGFVVLSAVCGWEAFVIHDKYRWLVDCMTMKMRTGSKHMRCLYIATFGHQK